MVGFWTMPPLPKYIRWFFRACWPGHSVSQAMSQRCVVIPPDATLQQVVDEHILSGGQRCVLVNRGENTVGLITLHQIKEVARAEWPTTWSSHRSGALDHR